MHVAWRKVQFEKTSSGVLFKFRPLTAKDVPWAATKKPPASSFVMGTQIRNASCVFFFFFGGGGAHGFVWIDLFYFSLFLSNIQKRLKKALGSGGYY